MLDGLGFDLTVLHLVRLPLYNEVDQYFQWKLVARSYAEAVCVSVYPYPLTKQFAIK